VWVNAFRRREPAKNARAPSAVASRAAAAQATPLQDRCAPLGEVPLPVIQAIRDEAAPHIRCLPR
jgi:hypothetical protein